MRRGVAAPPLPVWAAALAAVFPAVQHAQAFTATAIGNLAVLRRGRAASCCFLPSQRGAKPRFGWPVASGTSLRGFLARAGTRGWRLPGKTVGQAHEIEWGEPSSEEAVWIARCNSRDEVPAWARTMTLNDTKVEVRSYKGKELPQSFVEDAFALTKANMQHMYLDSLWGWSDEQKQGDLASDLARFFVAADGSGRLLGFIHYRFELIDHRLTHRMSTAAYVLELQVVDSARRGGLGSLLMQAVEEVAARTQMDSVMLCVFRYNHAAVSFYRDKMGYVVDESSAFNFNQNDVWELVKYSPASRGSPQVQAARSFGEQHQAEGCSEKGAGYAACKSQGHGQLPRRQSPLDDAAKPSRKRNKTR